MREHINKEDNILYPMADSCISKEKQETLLKGFDKIEEEIIKHGKHEEFHKLLDYFQKVYLIGAELIDKKLFFW